MKQAQALLNTPDATTTKGLRDRAILAVLLGCGLRRSEVAALTIEHIQQRDGRWCIVDLVGKHGRVRTVPMPTWVKVAIDAWTAAAIIADGHVFRAVNRGGQAQAAALSEKVVWQLLQGYAALDEAAKSIDVSPNTLLRWQKDPEFQKAYREARRLAFGQAIARLQQGSSAVRSRRTTAAARGSQRRAI